jgi:CIC family chloride channel protein
MDMQRKQKAFLRMIAASAVLGVLGALLADTLKVLTENYETRFFRLTQQHAIYFLVLPLTGLTLIYILRTYLFKRKVNKGIQEIYNSLRTRHNELPVYKIPSHFINGMLTVAFGGSTGIEVSAVVASASLGSVAQRRGKIHVRYRKELICAGLAAAVTALFNSPLAGALFALEVILRRVSRTALISILTAVGTAWLFNWLLASPPLFHFQIDHWNYAAFPYFLLLGICAGLQGAYLTRSVVFFKSLFARIPRQAVRILIGAGLLGICLCAFPALYGDGYDAMREIFEAPAPAQLSGAFLLLVIGVLVLKPIVTSTTLAAGGDGGVFAPSLFIGAFLGLLVATLLNHFAHAEVIPVNFMIAGMGAVLSASLHAPFTAVFLVCGIANDYTLLVPVLAASTVARLTAKWILPYTVYSYVPKAPSAG